MFRVMHSRKPPRPFPRTPSTSLSRRLLHHFAVLPHNDRQAEGAVLGFDTVRGPTHGAFRPGDEGRSFGRFAVTVLFHMPINFRTDSISCRDEIASRFAGSPRLSHTIQRVASGR